MVLGQAFVLSDPIEVRPIDKIYVRGLVPFATDLAFELGFHAPPRISDCRSSGRTVGVRTSSMIFARCGA